MKFSKILLTSFFSLLLLTISVYAANNPSEQGAVEQTITKYVNGVDSRKADLLENTLYQKANLVTYNSFTKKIEDYSASQFIELVSNGNKGGWKRDVNVVSVDFEGNTANAKVEITDARLKKSGYFSLVKDNDGWKIVSGVFTLGRK